MSYFSPYGFDPTVFSLSAYYCMLIGVGASSTTTYRNVDTVFEAIASVGGFAGGLLALLKYFSGYLLRINYHNSLIHQMFIYSNKEKP
jgi:hypothetical protein